ncbi:MAG: response regulator transcription factor [Bryobacterales bacterium]|nr:response regulator transcription factor [Bryobacterales bacterium]
MRILVVEDDPRMLALLRQGLEEEGHGVTVAQDGEVGLECARALVFDVIVVDVMLPKMDGLSLARRLRDERNRTPILMLTARDHTIDIVRGLDSGADDYLTKPFSFEVFLARLRAVGRRGPIPQPPHLRVADLELDPAARVVRSCGRKVNLSRTEFALLELLMRRQGNVVPREVIMDSVWGVGANVESNTLDAFVRLLRNKIEPRESGRLIRTERGIGYGIWEPER